jgi:hypothetical protein
MSNQTGKNMMTVLPYRLHNDKWCVRRNLSKDFDAMALAANESMFLDSIEGMPSSNRMAACPDGVHHSMLDIALSRPTGLIGGQP